MMAVDRGPQGGEGLAVRVRPVLLALSVLMGCGGSALEAGGARGGDADTHDALSPSDVAEMDAQPDVMAADAETTEDVGTTLDAEDLDTADAHGDIPQNTDIAATEGCAAEVDGAPCDDQNACTAESVCQDGRCVATEVVSCDDAEACTDDYCDPAIGCVHKANLALCDDGNPCSKNDFCGGGVCIPGPATCEDGNPCTRNDCDSNGACDFVPDDSLTCHDLSACTAGDYCAAGFCIGGPLDGCQAAAGACVSATCAADGLTCDEIPLDGAACEDGNACTEGDLCADGACLSGASADCGWDAGCADFMCDPIDGCVLRTLFVANTPCDDSDRCTLDTVCDATGRCQGGVALVCDDLNGCTVDSCEPSRGCVTTSTTGAPCDDSNACTSLDTCSGSYCRGDVVICDDGDPCTLDRCDPITGCVSSPLVCASDNPCEVGSCDGAGGCVFSPRAGVCDDGLICTTNDRCLAGECVGTTTCDDSDLCTLNVCDAEEGCVFVPFEGPCDDGDPCTSSEFCDTAGTCGRGFALPVVDDGVACTIDLCSAEDLGTHLSDPSLCGDGQGCSLGDGCVDGAAALNFELVLVTQDVAGGDAFAVVLTTEGDATFDVEGYGLRLQDDRMGVIAGLDGSDVVPVEPGARVALMHVDTNAEDLYAVLGPDIVIVGVFGAPADGMRWAGAGAQLTILSPLGRALGTSDGPE